MYSPRGKTNTSFILSMFLSHLVLLWRFIKNGTFNLKTRLVSFSDVVCLMILKNQHNQILSCLLPVYNI